MTAETISIYEAAETACKAAEAAYATMSVAHAARNLPNPRIPADSVLHLMGNDPDYAERMRNALSTAIHAFDEMARAADGRPTKADEDAAHEAERDRILDGVYE